jgi:hypothetical protein
MNFWLALRSLQKARRTRLSSTRKRPQQASLTGKLTWLALSRDQADGSRKAEQLIAL